MSGLECIPNSCVDSISLEHVKRWQEWLSEAYERPIEFPDEYVKFILRCHGGIPQRRCFKISRNRVRVVCRFLNLLKKGEPSPPLEKTWRQWAEHDIRLDYSAYSLFNFESWNGRFRENDFAEFLVPFAAIDFAGHDARGMDVYDLLCFDYRVSDKPPVVYWEFEEFHRYHPKKNLVAPSFAQFMEMLYDDPKNPILQEQVDHF